MNKKQEAEIEERILKELEEEASKRGSSEHPKDTRVKIEVTDAPEELKEQLAGKKAEKTKQTSQKEQDAQRDDGTVIKQSSDADEQAGAVSAEEESADADIPEDNGQSVIDEKRGLFGGKKKDKNKEKLESLTAKIAELEDKDLRRQAEFDNFRKRTEKEKAAQFESGEASVIGHILPVIDNFERGFAMVEDDDKEDAFVDGMNKVYKQLMTELEKIGVKPIEAVGKEFDPNLHNAVMQVDTGEYESGIIAQEMQKGYMLHDLVIRHSMVAVQS